MSNRTLLEINHDLTGTIAKDPENFVNLLRDYLNAPSDYNALELKHFGVTVLGYRHHSEPYQMTNGIQDYFRE